MLTKKALTANTLMMITTLLGVPALFFGTAYLVRKLDSKERLLAIEKGSITRRRRTKCIVAPGARPLS